MNLITDRTQNDVNRVKELAVKGKTGTWTEAERSEWLAGMKGAYNYSDWNRVETAVSEIASMLGVSLETVTTWSEKSIFTEADANRYLANIRKLRTACSGLSITPATPSSMHRMTFATANDIEKILVDMETVIYSWTRCGEAYCGE